MTSSVVSNRRVEKLGPIDWSQKVANPDALGIREKELWVKVEPIVGELLDELKRNGLIETVFVQKEAEALWSCVSKLDDFSRAHNVLLHLSDSKEKAFEFTNTNTKFGFDERTIVTIYVMAALTLSVLKTEVFKLVLLFHMKRSKRISHSVSRFVPTMQDSAPIAWAKLKQFVDNPLRNALAHGTYALVGDKIVLYDDATLEPIEKLELGDIMIRIKDQDVLFQSLINVLQAKARDGFLST